MVCGSLKGTVVAILIWRFTAVQNQPSWSQKQSARNHSFPLFSELPSILRISYAKPWSLLHIQIQIFLQPSFKTLKLQTQIRLQTSASIHLRCDFIFVMISTFRFFSLISPSSASDLCFIINLQASVSFSGFTLVQPFPQIRLTFIFNLNNPCSFG
jgi:hypothetical protein